MSRGRPRRVCHILSWLVFTVSVSIPEAWQVSIWARVPDGVIRRYCSGTLAWKYAWRYIMTTSIIIDFYISRERILGL